MASSAVQAARRVLAEKQSNTQRQLEDLEERRQRSATLEDELRVWSRCVESQIKLQFLSLREALEKKSGEIMAQLERVVADRTEELAKCRRFLEDATSGARQAVECSEGLLSTSIEQSFANNFASCNEKLDQALAEMLAHNFQEYLESVATFVAALRDTQVESEIAIDAIDTLGLQENVLKWRVSIALPNAVDEQRQIDGDNETPVDSQVAEQLTADQLQSAGRSETAISCGVSLCGDGAYAASRESDGMDGSRVSPCSSSARLLTDDGCTRCSGSSTNGCDFKTPEPSGEPPGRNKQ